MRTIKYRGKVDGVWWYVSPDHILSLFQSFWNLADLSTVGEYIGREDKNGKHMFEGDIIKYLDNTSQGLVEKTTVITDIRYLPDFGCSKWEEVIGNYWDNPELLEGGEA